MWLSLGFILSGSGLQRQTQTDMPPKGHFNETRHLFLQMRIIGLGVEAGEKPQTHGGDAQSQNKGVAGPVGIRTGELLGYHSTTLAPKYKLTVKNNVMV